jgi:hypothetical protein
VLKQLLLLAAFLPLAALAAETGYATRELELKVEPVASSTTTAKVPKNARVEILEEKRAWSRVKSGDATGWALSFYVMKGEPAPQVSTGRRLSELFSLGTERRSETTATIGIRGLDEEQLKSAQFNAEELKRLEALGLPKGEGDAFAQRGQLVPQKVDYLAPPVQ